MNRFTLRATIGGPRLKLPGGRLACFQQAVRERRADMPIRVRLIEDRELKIDVDPQEWREAIDEGRKTDQMIEIRNPEGRVLAINPQHILYWVEAPHGERQEVPA